MPEKPFIQIDREIITKIDNPAEAVVLSYIIHEQISSFKNTNINELPRQGVAKATKKFNTIKKAVDVLSNAKLNAVLDLLLTPTPLYEPTIEDIRKKYGTSYKSILEAEKPSDNQTE